MIEHPRVKSRWPRRVLHNARISFHLNLDEWPEPREGVLSVVEVEGGFLTVSIKTNRNEVNSAGVQTGVKLTELPLQQKHLDRMQEHHEGDEISFVLSK